MSLVSVSYSPVNNAPSSSSSLANDDSNDAQKFPIKNVEGTMMVETNRRLVVVVVVAQRRDDDFFAAVFAPLLRTLIGDDDDDDVAMVVVVAIVDAIDSIM